MINLNALRWPLRSHGRQIARGHPEAQTAERSTMASFRVPRASDTISRSRISDAAPRAGLQRDATRLEFAMSEWSLHSHQAYDTV